MSATRLDQLSSKWKVKVFCSPQALYLDLSNVLCPSYTKTFLHQGQIACPTLSNEHAKSTQPWAPQMRLLNIIGNGSTLTLSTTSTILISLTLWLPDVNHLRCERPLASIPLNRDTDTNPPNTTNPSPLGQAQQVHVVYAVLDF